MKSVYRILECPGYDHLFTDYSSPADNVNNIYSDRYFFDGGDGYPNYLEEEKILFRHGEYYAKKINRHINPGIVLDIGSAAGFILKGFENLGWKGTGIEPNATMVRFDREVLNLELHQGTIESTNLNKKFDLIIMIQVIAHLNDLVSSFERIKYLIKQDGFVLIETWDCKSLTARLFGRQWHE